MEGVSLRSGRGRGGGGEEEGSETGKEEGQGRGRGDTSMLLVPLSALHVKHRTC